MLKWLFRLLRRRVRPPKIIDHGRYVYKPVIARALSVVMNISQAEVVALVISKKIYFNGQQLQPNFAATTRLHSGSYEVKIPSQNRLYKFYIT